MTREEFIAEIRRIFSRECLSEDIHKCEYNGKCDEHEISKLVEVLEIYCKAIKADAIDECIEALGNNIWDIAKLEQLKEQKCEDN